MCSHALWPAGKPRDALGLQYTLWLGIATAATVLLAAVPQHARSLVRAECLGSSSQQFPTLLMPYNANPMFERMTHVTLEVAHSAIQTAVGPRANEFDVAACMLTPLAHRSDRSLVFPRPLYPEDSGMPRR